MSDQETEIVPPSLIVKKLSKETLEKLYLRERNDDSEVEPTTKTKMMDAINRAIDESGIDCALETMKREDLKAIAELLKVKFEETDNQNSKAVMSKKIKQKITPNIEEFLQEHADAALLNRLTQSLDLEPETKDKDKLVTLIADRIRELGAEVYWNSCDIETLHAATADLKLKSAKTTNSKRKLVDALLTNSNPEKDPRKKKKRKTEFSESRKAIEKGITYDDIFQHYNCDEIRNYCKVHGLKTSGKKKSLIERILKYLEGEDEEEEEKETKSSKDSKESKKKSSKD